MSPTIFIFESIKFKINANDHNSPHVHIEGCGAKMRVNLITLEYMDKETEFSNKALEKILHQIKKRKNELLEEWRNYHEKD